nr:CHXC14 [Albugo laibachii Nc14]|eukprot:CCA25269.1 CHXC14 [Albugo laibachii Nc14]
MMVWRSRKLAFTAILVGRRDVAYVNQPTKLSGIFPFSSYEDTNHPACHECLARALGDRQICSLESNEKNHLFQYFLPLNQNDILRRQYLVLLEMSNGSKQNIFMYLTNLRDAWLILVTSKRLYVENVCLCIAHGLESECNGVTRRVCIRRLPNVVTRQLVYPAVA